MALAVALLLTGLAAMSLPSARESARLLAAQDDPVRLAELGVQRSLDAATAMREIAAALELGDVDLAQSFIALSDEQGVAIEPALRARAAAAAAHAASPLGVADRFAQGFVTGSPDDTAALAGTIASDLLVVGDMRDVARETARAARGEEVDALILGLAAVGLAVTAGTYASLGAGAPARAGLSFVKAAGRAGRMGAGMRAAVLAPLRGLVDPAALAAALAPGAVRQPAAVLRAVRGSIRMDKARDLLRLAGNIGRVQAKAGSRAAFDALRIAETPQDLARLATLAAARGGKTRAVLRLLGRGAIALTFGAWQAASWLLWALLLVLGWCASLKGLTERAALRFIRRRKQQWRPAAS